ncbi:hypothetical protein M3223_20070 [Paenibacillus pasadenensis]|uniref:hypothetical protein n=1 Tax=Paenibacillus pasadenensis TaxID=217090 RepID=UPI00203EFBD4|nr:hypothetical protein [Paenibacillus pasadenensis]MCM3749652.1 hypothetical protein [Paenibacillus pasadenensis]
MRKGPKLLGLSLIMAGMLLGAVGWHFNHADDAGVVEAAVNVPASETNKGLQQYGIMLDPPDSHPSPPQPGLSKITEDRAIRNASWSYPSLTKEASSVSCSYSLMSSDTMLTFSAEALAANPELRKSGRLNRTPVFIVTFKNVNVKGGLYGSAAQAVPGNGSLREANVVVDALTGVMLLTYSYR